MLAGRRLARRTPCAERADARVSASGWPRSTAAPTRMRLLVADVDADGRRARRRRPREMEIVRLGQGVDRTGRLADDALERTFAAVRRVRRD